MVRVSQLFLQLVVGHTKDGGSGSKGLGGGGGLLEEGLSKVAGCR